MKEKTKRINNKNIMDSAYELKNGIIKYSIISTLICFAISVFVIGFNSSFARGLLIGELTAFINMNLLYIFLNMTLRYKLGFAFNFLGYIIRLSLYGTAIYICIKTSILCTAGTIIVFIMIKLSIYFINIKKI